jgi:hypothetical protein
VDSISDYAFQELDFLSMIEREKFLLTLAPSMKLLIPFLALLFASCATLRNSPKYQLDNGMYLFRQEDIKYLRTKVFVNNDSIIVYKEGAPDHLITVNESNQYFLKRSFDVDVVTVPFKYRPGSSALPRQLTTDFNGNIFIGYRFDRFRIAQEKTPIGNKKHYYHRGITIGATGGIGSTAITPWTTNNKITDEYSGFILNRGVAVMLGVNNLTVGIGIGWDYLTDRDKDVWIYQNKPWYGLTVGLNIN